MKSAHRIIKKHWATKKGKVSISILAICIIFIVYNILSFFFTLGVKAVSNTTTEQPITESALVNTNMHKLTSNEFAVVTKNNGKLSGKTVTRAIQLSNGQTYTLATDQNTAISIIDGSDTTTNYIKLSDDVTIHT